MLALGGMRATWLPGCRLGEQRATWLLARRRAEAVLEAFVRLHEQGLIYR